MRGEGGWEGKREENKFQLVREKDLCSNICVSLNIKESLLCKNSNCCASKVL